jgi:hypothetical protein
MQPSLSSARASPALPLAQFNSLLAGAVTTPAALRQSAVLILANAEEPPLATPRSTAVTLLLWPVPAPPRTFSQRAELAGDMVGASKLLRLERYVESLVAQEGSPCPLDTAVLTACNADPTIVAAIGTCYREGVSLDPGPNTPLPREHVWLANHTSAYLDPAGTEGYRQERRTWALAGVALLRAARVMHKFKDLTEHNNWDQYITQVSRSARESRALDFNMCKARSPHTAPPHCSLTAPFKPVPVPHAGSVRLIHDLSASGWNSRGNPEGSDLPPHFELDDLHWFVSQLNARDYLHSSDLENAFPTLATLVYQCICMGVAHEGKILIVFRMGFGGTLNPYQYTACLGRPLLYICRYLANLNGIQGKLGSYMDDYSGCTPSSAGLQNATAHYSFFGQATGGLGATVARAKGQPPTEARSMLTLGFIVDTDPVVKVTVPPYKLYYIKEVLASAASQSRLSRASLESVAGKILSLDVAIKEARTFSSALALLRANPGAKSLSIALNDDTQQDIHFWCSVAQNCNGTLYPLRLLDIVPGHMSSDAAGESRSDNSVCGYPAFSLLGTGLFFATEERRGRLIVDLELPLWHSTWPQLLCSLARTVHAGWTTLTLCNGSTQAPPMGPLAPPHATTLSASATVCNQLLALSPRTPLWRRLRTPLQTRPPTLTLCVSRWSHLCTLLPCLTPTPAGGQMDGPTSPVPDSLRHLQAALLLFSSNAFSEGTLAVYASHQTKWFSFCTKYGLSCLTPPTQTVYLLFLTWCGTEGNTHTGGALKADTIVQYNRTLKQDFAVWWPDVTNVARSNDTKLLIRGICNTLGLVKQRACPLTINDLLWFLRTIRGCPSYVATAQFIILLLFWGA